MTPCPTCGHTKTERRSLGQNSRYWKLIHEASKMSGNSAEWWHIAAKSKFIGYDEFEIQGERYRVLHSTARLSKKQMTEYMEAVEAWLNTEHGVTLGDMAA